MHSLQFMRIFPALYGSSLFSGLRFLYKTNLLLRFNSSMMKAVMLPKYGDATVLKYDKVPKPIPGQSEVLVKVYAAGINPVDVFIREGAFMTLPPLPMILGKEVAGIIESTGTDVRQYKEGERVACCLPRDGGYAEYVTCNEKQLIPLPSQLTFAQGACLYVTYFTAIRALLTKCNIKCGEWLLVHGASGGVGLAAVQIAKSKGMKIVGTASSNNGISAVKQAGADLVFNHSKEGYLLKTFASTEGQGFNVIFENCADKNLGNDFLILSQEGRIAVVGTSKTVPVKPLVLKPNLVSTDPRSLLYTEGTIFGVKLLSVTEEEFGQYSAEILKGIDEGWLRPIISNQFKLAQASEAHKHIQNLPACGNLVLNLEM